MKKAELHIQRAIELMDAVSLTKHNQSFGEEPSKNKIYEEIELDKVNCMALYIGYHILIMV